jgi:hypothetical protein
MYEIVVEVIFTIIISTVEDTIEIKYCLWPLLALGGATIYTSIFFKKHHLLLL